MLKGKSTANGNKQQDNDLSATETVVRTDPVTETSNSQASGATALNYSPIRNAFRISKPADEMEGNVMEERAG